MPDAYATEAVNFAKAGVVLNQSREHVQYITKAICEHVEPQSRTLLSVLK